MTRSLDLVVHSGLSPRRSLGEDRALADEASRGAGALRVYDLLGEVLALGRYHLAPALHPHVGGVQLCRRQSGGRAMPWGEGFVGLSLVLPHRSALIAPDPLALAPEQVMNRYVRGILEACALAGVPALYPGLDVITVERRILGFLSFEVTPAGALLFEAVLANSRELSVLPALLDRADPRGIVKARMLTSAETTCLANRLGRTLSVPEVADLLRRGFAQRFGVTFVERTSIEAADVDEEVWLGERACRTDLDRHASVATLLGVLEAHLAVQGGRISEVRLAGDFVANSPAITRLEEDLRGCPAEADAVEAVLARVFAEPSNFVLGVGPARTIAEVIVQGLAP